MAFQWFVHETSENFLKKTITKINYILSMWLIVLRIFSLLLKIMNADISKQVIVLHLEQ